MRHKKVRVRIPEQLRARFTADEVVAQIAVEGTVRDLLDHLEDAYPTLRTLLRGCRIEIGGRAAADADVIPAFTDVGLTPPVTP